MASWMIHFRIAECFISEFPELNNEDFIVGNIGPDCSKIDQKAGRFEPSSNVTHFTETGRKLDIDTGLFYEKYLESSDINKAKYSFYVGYFVHLLTDILWTKLVWVPTKEKYKGEFSDVREFLNIVRKDWETYDYLYIRNNFALEAFKTFCNIDSYDNDYMDFYDNDSISLRMKFIRKEYMNSKDKLLDEYKHFSSDIADRFIEEAYGLIVKELHYRGIR